MIALSPTSDQKPETSVLIDVRPLKCQLILRVGKIDQASGEFIAYTFYIASVNRLMLKECEKTVPGEQDIEAFSKTSRGASHETVENSSLPTCVDDLFENFSLGDSGPTVEAAPGPRNIRIVICPQNSGEPSNRRYG